MPRLDPETKQSIDNRLEVHERITQSFKGRQYIALHCRFCNWASNGLTLEEAIAKNRKHEAHHPEMAEWKANEIGISEIVDSLHDHDCEMALCACRCGCREGPFCHTVQGSLCSSCMIAEGRGHSEHGEEG